MGSFVFRSDMRTGHEPSRTRDDDEDEDEKRGQLPPSSAPRIPHSALGRFMGSFVFRSDLRTGHEPASRWDRRHPCRRVARGLPRRQGCRRSQVHGKRTPPNLDVSWDHERWLRGGNACAG